MSKINKIKVENEIYDVQDNTSGYVNKDVNNLTNYELKVSTANNILMTLNNTTYELTLSLRNSANEVLNTQSIDLPLETMVVDGEYDSTNKKIILELQNGNTIDVPVGDLINGLQSEITFSNKLDASLVDDSLSTNKFTNASEKAQWNAKADISDLPTKTSDLTNDSDFQTEENVNSLMKEYLYILDENKLNDTSIYPELAEAMRKCANDGVDMSMIYQVNNNGAGSVLLKATLTNLQRFAGGIVEGFVDFNPFNLDVVPISPNTRPMIRINYSYGTITGIMRSNNNMSYKTLTTGNTYAFTPTGDYNPATKKYVDDSISNIDLTAKEDVSNKVTSLDSTSTDTQYPSAKSVWDLLGTLNVNSFKLFDGNQAGTNRFKLYENLMTNVLYINKDMTLKNGISYFSKEGTSTSTAQTMLFYYIFKDAQTASVNEEIGYGFGFGGYDSGNHNISRLLIKKTAIDTYVIMQGETGNIEMLDSRSNYFQSIYGIKSFMTIPQQNGTTAPTQDNQFTNKKYVDDKPTTYSGYDATKTQVLKNINGTLTWVDE